MTPLLRRTLFLLLMTLANQIFIDRFGMQTTSVPDDNYFLEGKGSALYKRDDLQTLVDSQPGKLTGEQTEFDFGEEGDRTRRNCY